VEAPQVIALAAPLRGVLQPLDQPPGEALHQPGEQQDDDDTRAAHYQQARVVVEVVEEAEEAIQQSVETQ
jgi:hypothetical protein